MKKQGMKQSAATAEGGRFGSRANHGRAARTPPEWAVLLGRCAAREKPNFPMQSIGNNDG